MAVSTADLTIVLNARDQASGTINKVGGRLKGLGGAGNVAKLGLLATGTAAVAVGAGLLKIGADFDKAFDRIAVGTGATGENLKALKSDFKAVFAGLPTDMESASTAVADLNTRLGLTGEPLRQMSKQMLELSRITDTDVGGNIEQVTRVFGDWGIETDKQSDALDRLFKTSQATGPSVGRIGQLMVQYGAPLRQFGFGFEEGAALMGRFEKEGVNTELVMGSLRIALGKFAREGVPLREGLDKTIKRIQELGPGAEATAIAMETFGARAGPDMAATILEGKFAIDDLMATLEEGGEGILETARSTESLGEKFTRLKNRALVAIQPAASWLFDKLGELADLIETDLIPALSEWWQKHGPGIVNTLREIGGYLRDFFAPALDTLADLWQNLKPPMEAVGRFLIEHKPVLIAVAALILALVAPWLAVVAVVAVVLAKWDEISQLFTVTIPDAIKSAIAYISEIPVIGEIFQGAMDTVKVVVETAFELIKGRVQFFMDAIRAIIQIVTSLISGDWSGAWDGVRQLFNAAWELVKGDIQTAFEGVAQLARIALGTLGGVIGDIWDGVKTKIYDALNWIIDRINDFAGGINTVLKPLGGLLGKVGVNVPEVPTIPNIVYRTPFYGSTAVPMQGGGFVPPGVIQPAILHGGRWGEEVRPLGPPTIAGRDNADLAAAVASAIAEQLPTALQSVTIELDGEPVGRLISRYQGASSFMLGRGG